MVARRRQRGLRLARREFCRSGTISVSFRSRVRLLSREFLCTSRLRPGTARAHIRPVPGTPTLGSEFWEVSELENLSCQRMTFQCETPLQVTVKFQLYPARLFELGGELILREIGRGPV